MISSKTWVFDMLRELGLFLAASPRSRLWQLQNLRELDAERLDDIGVTPAEAWQGRRTESAPASSRGTAATARYSEAARAGAM
ncbi:MULTISPECIES: DUF1127 domain-containing protein [Ensifer]|jgi:hypothetical protein|uniref:DUF1127 domain-containing protein n=1 Tax=Ensifer canadensis TaxID=555315 RepID=A0AAW4FJ67_9HYPH|nr:MULTISPECIES: DUF1127 domain-containing protein [Ensifer]MDP9632208.1 hypothetical protein [Ensifer adhaerens]MBD9488503.1 DUF1127 domain-containing protein [Ensifer sp. ENS11]MBM3092138.1 hypothetical protein [Ensifer canadensis]NOV16198.1 DUF1127 domain-containing protein [Ensifer canadensis]UBI73865.1 DUF1127 domain-containing protein [Ensifer canadensis]